MLQKLERIQEIHNKNSVCWFIKALDGHVRYLFSGYFGTIPSEVRSNAYQYTITASWLGPWAGALFTLKECQTCFVAGRIRRSLPPSLNMRSAN